MKSILLLAAGGFGAAGLITMAAPASAEPCAPAPACNVPDQPATFVNGIATQSQQFQTNLQSQISEFKDSIDPAKLADTFLNTGGTDSHGTSVPGVTKQVQVFVDDVKSQIDDVRSRLSGSLPDSESES